MAQMHQIGYGAKLNQKKTGIRSTRFIFTVSQNAAPGPKRNK